MRGDTVGGGGFRLSTLHREDEIRKCRLETDALAVESFEILAEDGGERGTVLARQESGVETCVTCVNCVCWEPRLQTNCCTRNPAEGCSLPRVC